MTRQKLQAYEADQSVTKSNLEYCGGRLGLLVDIESFWTEGYAGQIPNSGHEIAIYVL